jgi:prophage regulatory protein
MNTEPNRFMRRPEVLAMLGVSSSTLYALIRARKFPPAVGIGDRAVAWSRRAVLEWADRKIAEADGVG